MVLLTSSWSWRWTWRIRYEEEFVVSCCKNVYQCRTNNCNDDNNNNDNDAESRNNDEDDWGLNSVCVVMSVWLNFEFYSESRSNVMQKKSARTCYVSTYWLWKYNTMKSIRQHYTIQNKTKRAKTRQDKTRQDRGYHT